MSELYNILSIFVTSGLFLALGLVLLFADLPGSPLLGNYRVARYMMAAAYLFFACVNLSEYLFSGAASDVPLLRTITLTIAASQAFLFTFAMLALLEVRFPGWRSIFREGIPVALLIAAVFIVYAFCPGACSGIAFWGFAGIYALLLTRYTALFTRNYRRFRLRMDNWFSGDEAGRMRWVAFSFFAALAIGVGALLTSVFMSTLAALAFTLVFDIFYTFFAIRFISYATRFHAIEEAMENSLTGETMPPGTGELSTSNGKIPAPANLDALEKRIEEWIAGKGYTEKGITINMLVSKLYTNSHYLSAYINTREGKTFRAWINELRIGEARRLLAEYPGMNIGEIASRAGFATKSHFGQQFRAVTGTSPSNWRQRFKN
jgi:AraC-like DNA-binding protein